MSIEHLLQSTAKHCSATAAQKKAIKERVLTESKAETWLTRLAKLLSPTKAQVHSITNTVRSGLDRDATLQSVRESLSPSIALKEAIAQKMQQGLVQKANHWLQVNSYRWLAAFTAVVMVVTISPRFVVAPQIFADAEVRLAATEGTVWYTSNGQWQTLNADVEVKPGMQVKTEEGQATISFRDDAVVRLAPFTQLSVNDTQAIGGSAPELLPTFTVKQGNIWVQGLVPSSSRGVTFALPTGFTTVYEGSFSVQVVSEASVVSVWNKSVIVRYNSMIDRVNSSERAHLADGELVVDAIEQKEFAHEWVTENLAKDAVHRQYIAKLQEERLKKVAGTLPTSSLYPVKRFAERVDVLLTFNEEERLKKQLNQANNRLTEAVALLSDGSDMTQAEDSIREYQVAIDTILDSNEDGLSELLLKQSLQDIQSHTAALKPTDEAYVIKETVLKAESALRGDTQNQTVVLDTLDAVQSELEAGNTDLLNQNWELIVKIAEQTEVSDDDVLIEAKNITRTLQSSPEVLGKLSEDQRTALNTVAPIELEQQPEPTVPVRPNAPVRPTYSISEVHNLVSQMYENIYIYTSPRGRENQLRTEMLSIKGNEEEGRLLRSLYRRLPAESELTHTVRTRIAELGE